MIHAQVPELLGHRYTVLEQIGHGALGVVYKARDRLTEKLVALKRVKSSSYADRSASVEGPQRQETTAAASTAAPMSSNMPCSPGLPNESWRRDHLALAHEFRMLASLRHRHIVSVLDYGFADDRPYFTMELLYGCKTLREAALGLGQEQRIWLLAQVLLALVYLHRRGILHRDIKPSNVLCMGEQVKLVDFGVATVVGTHRPIAGTVEFMAPEVMLGSPATPASDLYSLGIMACELLSGHYPFDRSSALRFLYSVLDPETISANSETLRKLESLCQHLPQRVEESLPPSAPSAEAALEQIEPLALQQVVRRLMARSPAQRFQSAAAALYALGRATGICYDDALAGTRESFLQAARLVGRDRELGELEAALQAATEGRGSMWLVGGESGVGKSRLLDELRALALVQGIQVVRGQAHSEGGQAYEEWSEVLKPLCLRTALSELTAGVLKPLLPELPQLLERPIVAAPEVGPAATQQRLCNTVLDLLCSQSDPTLILLEDLHWSSVESLALLRRLLPLIGNQPLLLIASYRIEEHAELPAELPGCQCLRIGRLQFEQIAELTSLMLGEAGQTEPLLAFVARESEGNTFFMIEIVRALVEEAGDLENIRRVSPSNLRYPGGIQSVLSRRLGRVPKEWRELLLLAAVAGRHVDVRLLETLNERAEEFLRICASAAVLEPFESAWRFSHDKLREAALASLSAKERQRYHGQLAVALLRAYPDSSSHLAALAYHYREAGELHRAAHYSAQAGEEALKQGALSGAAQLLEQALRLQEQTPTSLLQQLRTRRLLVSAQFGLGQLKACALTHEQALRCIGKPLYRTPLGGIAALASQVARQILHRCGEPFLQRPRDLEQRARLNEELLLWSRAAEAYIMLGNSELAGYGALSALNLAEQIEDCARQVFFYTFLAYGLGMVQQRRLSRYYLRLAKIRAGAIKDTRTSLEFLRMSGLINLGEGRFQQSDQELGEAADLARQLGDDYLLMFCIACRALAATRLGHRERQLSLLAALRAISQRNENAQYLAIVQIAEGYTALLGGRFTQSMMLFSSADECCQRSADILNRLQLDSSRALCLLRMGEPSSARRHADATVQLLQTAQLSTVGFLPTLEELCNVYLSLWEEHKELVPEVQLQRVLKMLLQHFDRLARAFPVCRSCVHLMRGRLAWRCGFLATALRHLRTSLQYAQAFGMLPAQAWAHYFLGRFGRSVLGRVYLGTDGRQHLTAAIGLFLQLGDRWAWERALRMRDGQQSD